MKRMNNFRLRRRNFRSKRGESDADVSKSYLRKKSDDKYEGFNLYFPEESFEESSVVHRKLQAFEKFISDNLNRFDFNKIEEFRAFPVDFGVLMRDERFKLNWVDFVEDLEENAETSIKVMGLAMHQYVIERSKAENLLEFDKSLIRARILNREPILALRNLKVNSYGKLVSVRGTAIKVGNAKQTCLWMAFECFSCGHEVVALQPNGIYTLPRSCPSAGCNTRFKFIPNLGSEFTKTEDRQTIKLQELIGTENSEGGRMPRTIECDLSNDLVDKCVPGDDVTITGLMKVRGAEEKQKQSTAVFQLYLDAVSVVNNKSDAALGSGALEFNDRDYLAIRKIHSEPYKFRLLVHSLCPSIYGHEIVKAGLILALFGGHSNSDMGENRADSHVLMVGDPGLGKSQMLQACSNAAPRGVFVCGNTSTSSGLTVTVTRDGGDFGLEAGALVLADQGCCCIDEFDKMTNQHAALLEAMEQQNISIAKAGVVCTLPARTTILAAANPIGGHYDKSKTVCENLKMSPALLSRFDLVFVLLDQPNEVLDALLSEHVFALHSGKKVTSNGSFQTSLDKPLNESTLKNRLKFDETLDPLPLQLFRKYIAYAKKYVQPTLTEEAGQVLQSFYLELRRQHMSGDVTPVTARQLQSLVRLTQARAKLDLREEATAEDASDVIEIMKHSLVDTFSDQFGNLDMSRSVMGSGSSKGSLIKKLLLHLQRRAEAESRCLFTHNELKVAVERCSGGVTSEVASVINSLNVQGYLLKKADGKYQLLSADF